MSQIEKRKEKHSHQKKIQLFNAKNNLSKKERIFLGVPPNEYLADQYLLTMNPYTGRTHPENLYNLQEKLKKESVNQQRTPGDAIDNQWTERGPNNVGGRTRMVMFDPNDVTNKRVFAGGVSGGLWVNDDITDENSSWLQVGIADNLAVTCMAVDPNNSQIMYLGTGELYSPQQALGNGIWKSTDGGATWNNVYQIRGATSETSYINVPGTYFMTDIIVRDKDGNSATTDDSEVFAAIGGSFYSSNPLSTWVGLNDYGIYKSTDDGSNWSKLTLDVDGNSISPNDFELGIDNTLWLSTTRNPYTKGGGRIYSSSDGTSFTLKHTITNGRRTEIALSKTNANTVYVLGEIGTLSGDDLIAPFISILKTDDAFATSPTVLSLPNDATSNISANDFTRGQAFYDLVVEVDPTNDAIAYVGGINLFRTTDSGVSWQQISKNSPTGSLPGITVSYVHSDQQSWAFHPTDANIAVLGCDGGVFYANSLSAASSSASAIEERNKDYNTIQFYNAAISQTIDPEYIIGGTQDNGNLFFDDATSGINSAIKTNRGDGTHCFIDKDGSYMVISNLYNNITRYNLPYTGTGVTISSDSDSGIFVNPMALDDNLDILYTNGYDAENEVGYLTRFTNITTASSTRTDFSDPLITNISALKVSPFTTTSSKVFLGTRAGKLIKVENANTATPTITDISSNDFFGNISSVEFGASENEIMVTFYNFGVESIWFTEDGGTTWANKEGDFPDINVRCILMNPLNNDEVIVGSELGVWNTNNFKDASPIWNQSYNGMSNVAVTSFSLRTTDNTILASSYGRGFYTGKFTGNDLTTWLGTVDSDFTNTNNWSNGLPSNTVDVKISTTSNNPIINSAISVANISIDENAALTITESGALTIEENCTNQGSLTINSTLANSGSLIVKGTSTGKITYNRYASNNWHLISAPLLNDVYDNDWVTANSIQSGSVNTNSRAIGTYNNNSGNWEYMQVNDSENFTAGRGFSIKRTTAGNHIFLGDVATETVNIGINKGTTTSYNLLGNPFSSYLAINETADFTNNFLNANETVLEEKTIYVWNGSAYETKNQASSAVNLAPGQAFFVISKSEGGTATFAEILQQHQSETFLKQQSRPEIRIFCKNDTQEKYTDIFYIASATNDFDNGYDSSLYADTASNFEVFTELINGNDTRKLAIQSIPIEFSTIIPIGIIADKNSDLEISVNAKNINADLNVYLEDKKLGTFTLLNNSENKYQFKTKEALNGSGRFYLHTTSEVLSVLNPVFNDVDLFVSGDKIQIQNLNSEASFIKIYDTKGKLILMQKLKQNQDEVAVNNFSKGIYVVVIEQDNSTFTKKIIIQ
ncbi:T9SS type A sorting domain-containing protein [Polaribacter reichenbachii]|uniref:T9SS type A sorting domain-containing protein n=1 Tax=Polaribacter reichenbachii TaxID=996801 RepID=UPI001CFF5541|nr:T9SS type A sorting domain-containing protein [Polaribacter reichenbachii]